MALTLIKEDGTGKADANSYATAADGDAYHEGHLYAAAWTAATTANKEKALVMATRVLDAQVQFHGWRATSAQALQWPRRQCPNPEDEGDLPSDAVARVVLDATCELARELLVLDRTAAPPGEGIIAQWTDTGGTKYSKFDQRPVVPRFVQAMLARLGTAVGTRSGGVTLVRS